MFYCRINLEETNYDTIDFKILKEFDYRVLDKIYTEYCKHKKFKSVMPLFESELTNVSSEIIGYYDLTELVGFSYIKKYDSVSVEGVQFAWDYKNPDLRLGIRSLKSECAYYKSLGFKHYYLGHPDNYKKQIKGFEILGPR
jgi:hypothetical protein